MNFQNKLPHSLTTVTTFSKLLALFLFITLPFIGFYLGMQYQLKLTPRDSSTNYINTSQIKNNITDSIQTWQTYTDTDYQFQFEYPQNWSIQSKTVDLTNDEGQPDLLRFNLSPSEKLDQYDITNPSQSNEIGQIRPRILGLINGGRLINTSNTAITIDGNTAIKKTHQTSGDSELHIPLLNTNTLVLYIQGLDDQITLDHLISSFKFLNQIDTSNWQTYQDPNFNYSFKYPEAEWILTSNIHDPLIPNSQPDRTINLVTQRQGNPTTDELTTSITITTYDNPENQPLSKLLEYSLPQLSESLLGNQTLALKRTRLGLIGLQTTQSYKLNNQSVIEVGSVRVPSSFHYSTYIQDPELPYMYSIELELPLPQNPNPTDPDSKYLSIYNLIVSNFKVALTP